MKLQLIATATFGLEAVVRREIENLGYQIVSTEDGKITYTGDEKAIVRSNLWLRTSDRVQIKMAEFKALEFEDLFQQIKGISWEEWIPIDGCFVISGSSVKSKLSSVPAVQSVSEKAIVSRLSEFYQVEHFEKTGARYDIKVSLLKDRVTVTLDTTGPGLNKRGYRRLISEAPIKETMAAAMVQLSFWKPTAKGENPRILVDPCCGSGTIPIEAAMIGKNIAPGLKRTFASEKWDAIPAELWKQERANCYKEIRQDVELKIFGSDIDPEMIKIAKINAAEAGVDDVVKFNACDVSALHTKALSGVMVTNPPYGQRIGDRRAIDYIYGVWNKFFGENPTWSLFAITSDKTIEQKVWGKPADRRRKLYNGRLEVCYYQFHGQKPPKMMNEQPSGE